MTAQQHETVVIGGGQAGLATAYYLAKLGQSFVVLDAGQRVGDVWRNRWDSLTLFTPARYSSLPGLPFPAEPGYFPTRLEMAEYLESYAGSFALPVRLGIKATRLSPRADGFELDTTEGVIHANQVVIATGAFPTPRVPPAATQLDPAIHQVHSSAYHNPDQLPPGDVLVAGAASSGTQIALDLAANRRVWLAGKSSPFVPNRILGFSLFGLLTRTVFRVPVTTTPGQRIAERLVSKGYPVVGYAPSVVEEAGILRVPRVVGQQGGWPELADGQVLKPAVTVWATGFRYDYNWIDLRVFGEDGKPRQRRGVVDKAPGLYFIGLPFMYSGLSAIITGVGADAAHIARHIGERAAASEQTDRAASRLPQPAS